MTTPRHQVASATARMRATADTVVDAPVWSMDAAETAVTLIQLAKLKAQVAELEARVARHADELQIGHDAGATSTANWLAHHTRQSRTAAHRVVRFGYDLDTHDHVRTALAHGHLLADQAAVIVAAVKALPEGLDPDLVIEAEQHLVREAADYDAKALKRLGDRLLDVIDPDHADEHEARLLEREEAAAAMACRLTLTDDGHGSTHGRFTLPTLHAAALRKMLLALAAPKHQTATHGAGAGVERRPGPERMGRAFAELIERIPATNLPQVGGRDATLVVTIDLDTLTGRLEKAGILDTDERISPSQARRLACTAKILPAILNGRSEVLDLGRTRRFHTKAQRLALAHRDHGCTAEGCDWPPGLSHAHHDPPWSAGGPTDLDHARLLCPKHHAIAHQETGFHRRP